MQLLKSILFTLLIACSHLIVLNIPAFAIPQKALNLEYNNFSASLNTLEANSAEKKAVSQLYKKAQQYFHYNNSKVGYNHFIAYADTTENKNIAVAIYCIATLDFINYLKNPEGFLLFGKAKYLIEKNNLPKASIIYYLTQLSLYKTLNKSQSLLVKTCKELHNQALKNNDNRNIAFSNYSLAIIYYELSLYDSAKIMANDIIANQLTSLQYREVINLYNLQALTENKLGNYKSAINIYNKGLQLATSKKDTSWIGLLNGNIGDVYYNKKNYPMALQYLQKDIQFSLFAKEFSSAANAFFLKGKIYFSQFNQKDSANYCFNQAISNAKKHERPSALLDIYKKLNQFYFLNELFQEAYNAQAQYHIVRDSLMPSELELKYKNYEAKQQLNNKDYEIQMLNAKNEIQLKEAQRRDLILMSLCAILVLLSITLAIAYKSKQQQKINNEKISNQKIELEKQAEELINTNVTKDKIFVLLSHDLRAPLASLKGILDLLDNKQLNANEFDKVKNKVSQQLNSLNFVLDNLLHWSKNQLSPNNTNNAENINLKDIVDNNIRLFAISAEEKSINIISSISKPLFTKGNYTQLDIVVRNLLSNAIKFTPFNGLIVIDGNQENNHIKISIKDNGIGIAGSKIEYLFYSAFNKSEKGTLGEKGTGIGLWLCKEIIEQHRGIIQAKQNEKQGTTFSFTLPLA